MDVLCVLAADDGDVLSRETLIEKVWGVQFGGDESLSRAISVLRKNIIASGVSDQYIETIPKRGYRLVQPVSGLVSGAEEPTPQLIDPSEKPAPRTAAVIPSASPLLAVLAFDNLSADPELGYFCDGVSDEIRRTVANGSDLKVVARSSSFQFRGTDKSVDVVAKALGASHLLDGTVRRSGSQVRITAELVDCQNQSSIWAERFDGDIADMFELQDSIAAAVVETLRITFSTTTPAKVLDPASYEDFLKARGILAEGDPLFDDSAAEAAPLFEQVLRAEPKFAPAWELLATSRAWMLRAGRWEGSYKDGRNGVEDAAYKALRLDPKRAGAFVALAMLEPWGAYAARETLLRQALKLSPHDPVALNDMSSFCWCVGRFREALHLAEQACELNPLMPSARLHVAQMRTYVGDYEASIRMLQDLHERWPDNAGILLSLTGFAATLGFWDAYDASISAIGRFKGWQAADLKATKSYAEALRSNDPKLKARRTANYATLLERTGTIPLNLLESIANFGMVDEAFSIAERASFDHIFNPEGAHPSGTFPGLLLGPFSFINKTPRFVALCNRLGLCKYWDDSQAWPDCVGWTPYDFKSEARRMIQEQA